MACDISHGRKASDICKTVGGIKAIYIWNWDDSFDVDTDFVFTGDDSIGANVSGAPIEFFKYETRGGASFDEAGETSEENGTVFYTTTGTVQLKRQDSATRKELKLMAYGRPRVMVEDWNGDVKMYGLQNGCTVSFSTASGTSMGDFNGYSINITATEVEPANFVGNWYLSPSEATIITS